MFVIFQSSLVNQITSGYFGAVSKVVRGERRFSRPDETRQDKN
jgi:hypothetical protein